MAILGLVTYTAKVSPANGGNLYSQEALANPNQPAIAGSLKTDFIKTTSPALANIVTETHVQPGDLDPQGRMGRLITFLADMANGIPAGLNPDVPLRSIAASRNTAVDINSDGTAQIVRANKAVPTLANVYFVTAANGQPNINNPLSWQGVDVIRVAAGGTFDLNTWKAGGVFRQYRINAVNGLLAVEGNNDYY